MRVKNEARYLGYSLASLEALGGPILLLDDGSTDETPDIARACKLVSYRRQDKDTMDEGRDRTELYRWALETGAEWVLTLDGDEALAPPTAERILAALDKCPDAVNVFNLCLAVMATGPDETPKKWFGPMEQIGCWDMDRIFRVRDADPEHEFKSQFPSNLHCGCVPAMRARVGERLNAFIEYYGYESAAAIERKRAFYQEHDPVHFPSVNELWERRARYRPITWNGATDCREIGRGGTVSYKE